ncbi:WD40 repeat domain-containing protein [Actinoplanes philippinensis]|uniref:WD40 repeat domain-containing protein n=1 Tax=Actinoplanes philippinensis TaxID=35752 RepID=UPI0033C375BB
MAGTPVDRHAGYEDVGGIEHALARTAESTYDQLTEDDRRAARSLFTRLVVPGDGVGDTKRRARRADLPVPDALLDRLAAARLITLGRDSVELTHEALLRAWPRLAGWIDQDRDVLRLQHRLAEAAAVWRAHDRDPDDLYRGASLDQVAALRDRLNEGEREFLDAALRADHLRAEASRRAARRLRRLAAGMTVLAVLLAGTALAAAFAQQRAARQRNDALSLRASVTARDMLAGRPRDAAVLALAAYRLAPTAEARDALLLAHAAGGATTLGRGYLDPPGRYALTYGDDTDDEQLWRRDGPAWVPAGRVSAADSHLHLAGVDELRAIYRTGRTGSDLWDLADLDHPYRIAAPAGLGMLDGMDRTGSLLSAVGADGTARVWRPGDPGFVRLPPGDVVGTAVLADGSGIVLSRRDGDQDAIESWTPDGRLIAPLLRVPHPAVVQAGAGGLVAVNSYLGNATVTILDVSDPRVPRTVARADGLDETTTVVFDAAGRTVAVVDGAEARIWDARSGARVLSLHTQGLRLNSPRLDGDRLYLLDGKSALWRIDTDVDAVIRQTCARPVDVDWDRDFPGADPVELCPAP